jgi:hypothetical protein
MNFSMKTRSSPKLDLASAAAGGGLDHHRVADLLGHRDRLGIVGDDAEMPGNR